MYFVVYKDIINIEKTSSVEFRKREIDRFLFIEIAHEGVPHIADFFCVLAIERIRCERVLEIIIFKISQVSSLFLWPPERMEVIASLLASVFLACRARSPFSKFYENL